MSLAVPAATLPCTTRRFSSAWATIDCVGAEVAHRALEVDDARLDVHHDGVALPLLVRLGLGGRQGLGLYVVQGGGDAAYVVVHLEPEGPGAREERRIGLEGDALVGVGDRCSCR